MKRLKDPSNKEEGMTIARLSQHLRENTISLDEANKWMQYFFRKGVTKSTRLMK